MDNQIDPIIRMRDIPLVTGLCRSAIYKLIAEGSFPAPILLSQRARGIPLSRVQAWIDGRPSAR